MYKITITNDWKWMRDNTQDNSDVICHKMH